MQTTTTRLDDTVDTLSTGLIEAATTRVGRVVRAVVPPMVGAIYLGLWIQAEIGRTPLTGKFAMFSLFAVAIGLSAWMPRTAMAMTVAIPVLQFVNLVHPPEDTTWPSYEAIGVVLFFVGVFGRGPTRLLALPVAVVTAALAGWIVAVPTASRPYAWGSWTASLGHPRRDALLLALAALVVFAVMWLVGLAVDRALRSVFTAIVATDQRLDSTAAELEETDLELRLEQDRARISRDVHDALAHSLAIVVSQAQGAMALAPTRPEVAGQALETIAGVGRTALIDVRMLVERIQGAGDVAVPTATLDDLPELVASMRSLGMTIRLETPEPHGSWRNGFAATQQLAVYRIVQESLTNALKHAGPTSVVDVHLRLDDTGLRVTIASTGGAALDRTTLIGSGVGSRGVGIEGMKERARLAGGWLTAGPAGAIDPGEDARSSSDAHPRFVVDAFVPRSPEAVAIDV